MLLQNEIPFVEGKLKELAKRYDLQEYANELKASKEYKDFETRLSWDVIRAACGVSYLCDLYDKYGANDSHISTLAKKAIKCLNLVY